jgi:hypothetical protein
MTEVEWLTATDPAGMIEFARSKISERRTRLLTVAACRISEAITDPCCLNALDAAEQYSDGLISAKALRDAEQMANASRKAKRLDFPDSAAKMTASKKLPAPVIFRCLYFHGRLKKPDLKVQLCSLIREVVGNPFCPCAISIEWLAWNDGTVFKIAQAIYEDRAFDRMPILADALEDAGCADADMLRHCREPGEHVRGCWVIDLLLGKE